MNDVATGCDGGGGMARLMERVSRKHRLVIPSDRRRASEVQNIIMSEVEGHRYPDSACFGVRLALEEALANAVRHGNCGDPAKRVTIEYSVDDDAVTISVGDEGCGFEPEKVPDPTLDENLERPCGRGVMLMKAYMTEVHFNPRGNCVTMIKRRDCPLPITQDE